MFQAKRACLPAAIKKRETIRDDEDIAESSKTVYVVWYQVPTLPSAKIMNINHVVFLS